MIAAAHQTSIHLVDWCVHARVALWLELLKKGVL